MDRPTAVLRRLLLLEFIQDQIAQEIASLKQQMRQDDLRIVQRKVNVHDVWIEYVHHNHYDEAIFMRKMLDAESRGRFRRTGMTP